MPKTSMAQIRKCVYPHPTYEAHFADGTVARMSFWSAAGKPWDFNRGWRVLATAYRKQIVAGYVEHDDQSKPWVRVADPFFTGEAVAVRRRKPKRYKETLAYLVDWIDGEHEDESAIVAARALLAA